jgi:glycosyltransferase involved in cell wall biosynthesis
LEKPIRIGFDAHMVGGRETGNETYALGLIDGFRSIDGDFLLIVFHTGNLGGADSHFQFRRLVSQSPWTRLGLDLPLRSVRDGIDVLHTTYTAPVWARCPIVLTVHDISFESHPEWFSTRDLRVLKRTVPWSIQRAARVITVSDVCRREIIERYQVPEEKVVRVYNAAGPASQSLTDSERRRELALLGLDSARPIVLAVGNLQPRKNLVRLVKAFDRLTAGGLDAELVLVGPEHYRAELITQAATALNARIRFTGYISDRQLAACYASATAFVFPSMYEGFGIPALEAMAHGTPVACASAGALPEVCGDAALYFDALDVESIAAAIQRLMSDAELRSKLSRAGRIREQEFSWRRAAEATLAVYRDTVAGRQLHQTMA